MLSREEHSLVYQHAYVPEHIPTYVEAISDTEAHLHGDYLCFCRNDHLTFIGYPLTDRSSDLSESYQTACNRFQPATVAIIAPEIWLPGGSYEESQPRDDYFRLDLPMGPLSPGLAYMVRRAQRELQVRQGEFGSEHRKLVTDFISAHQLSREHALIFKRIRHYATRSTTARVLEARKGNLLVAFNIVDVASAKYAFYLFNFRSISNYVPGASDLLFHEMVLLAQAEEKETLNLGLGIHPGVRRFKEKWGGLPFLGYSSAIVRRKTFLPDSLLRKL